MRRLFFPILMGLVGCAVLVSLGTWQLKRLAWKEEILAEIDARITAAPLPLAGIAADADADALRYTPVRASGVAGPEEIHVLTSVEGVGAGYRLIVPLQTQTRRVMLDLGYIPLGAKNESRAYGPVTVTGNLQWPRDKTNWTPKPDARQGIWYSREVPDLAAVLNTEPLMIVARQVEGGPPTQPLPVTSAGIPNDHLGYAITWFGLALVWAVMSLVLIRRTLRSAR